MRSVGRLGCGSGELRRHGVLKDVGGDICLPSEERRNVSAIIYHRSLESPMGLGTKNRQKQTAAICKQHLREKYSDKLGLVEEFVEEIEGPAKNSDVTRWGQ